MLAGIDFQIDGAATQTAARQAFGREIHAALGVSPSMAVKRATERNSDVCTCSDVEQCG